MHVALHDTFRAVARPITLGAGRRVSLPADDLSGTTAAHILAIAERGDRAAFTLLFARFAPRIKSMLMRRGNPEPAAEELAQEAMLNVWRKAASFDPARGSGETWIFTIARNAATDASRRAGLPPLALEAEPERSDPTPLGDAVAEAAEAAKRLREAVRALPADQLEVIRQAFFEDRSHSEIAAALSVPLGTVKSRLRLALTRLRRLVEDLA